MNSGDTWWAASDLGWVVGHSYICYGPLISGLTTVIFEGKPVGTPDAGTYFRVIRDHHVRGMFTAPTALRAIRKEDPEAFIGKLYNTSCLQYLFVAGEHCDYETLEWARDKLKVPVLDNWWQTETGSPMTATCVGLGNNLYPPREVSGMPVPGWDVQVVHEEKQSPAKPGELGRILIKLPLPPGSFSTLYKNEEKFKEIYFTKYPGYYDTMDAGMIDEYGFISVLSREDDVINVAGHRLSTSALEEAIMSHPDVVECAVFGVPDALKGEVPLGLYVMKNGTKKTSTDITKELIALVRQLVGPVAAFRLAAPIKVLPKTRSGKIARKSISDMAKNKGIRIPTTIEDPSVYQNVKEVLNELGFALDVLDL
ncbi:acyl-CoA synthetase short-chain family member 3, mitochondrial-like [Limulus polyphemus]|uniref:Acyl-CoA synthetase short-chain family member 3, mitochondrial n=1 Tax=Limulus polyphemus TaxID=6850 RepID=A0ABM1BQG9_LIMPO|nr:acyl-CoA synthetase short-chain family member 3, mitochondrial-like [Limulus polyphemus]